MRQELKRIGRQITTAYLKVSSRASRCSPAKRVLRAARLSTMPARGYSATSTRGAPAPGPVCSLLTDIGFVYQGMGVRVPKLSFQRAALLFGIPRH